MIKNFVIIKVCDKIKNMSMFNKIVIVSLSDKYTRKVAKCLSQSLGMLYCDSKDLIEYELIDRNTLKKIADKEYLDNAETKVFKHIASFENVVVAINFDYLLKNFEILNNGSLFVFLKLSKKYVKENSNSISAISYDDRTEKLEKMCKVTVLIKKTDEKFVCDKILDALGGVV